MRHRLDGKRYAIKIIQLKKDQPALNKEIEKEAVTLANLQHHRIVQYKFVRELHFECIWIRMFALLVGS